MTPDLEKLESLAKAATPGPWVVKDGANSHVFDQRISLENDISVAFSEGADAAFIAAACEAVPSLIARVRELEAVLKPFADEAAQYDENDDDDAPSDNDTAWSSDFTVGELRAAHQILKGTT
jgi:hypothetical protein